MLGAVGFSGYTGGGNGGGGGGGTGVSQINFDQTNFEADGVTVLNPFFTSDNINLYYFDSQGYLNPTDQWQYVSGGIEILIPGFDAKATGFTCNFIAQLKIITVS